MALGNIVLCYSNHPRCNMPRCGFDLSAHPPLPSLEDTLYEILPSGNNRILHCPGSKDSQGEREGKQQQFWHIEDCWQQLQLWNEFGLNITILHAKDVPQAHYPPQGKKLTGHWCREIDQGQGQRGFSLNLAFCHPGVSVFRQKPQMKLKGNE